MSRKHWCLPIVLASQEAEAGGQEFRARLDNTISPTQEAKRKSQRLKRSVWEESTEEQGCQQQEGRHKKKKSDLGPEVHCQSSRLHALKIMGSHKRPWGRNSAQAEGGLEGLNPQEGAGVSSVAWVCHSSRSAGKGRGLGVLEVMLLEPRKGPAPLLANALQSPGSSQGAESSSS